MIVDRYYYHQLNKTEQVIYNVFYKGVMKHQDVIPLPLRGHPSMQTFEKIFAAVTRDNPLIYYLNQSACNIVNDSKGHLAICPQYFFEEKKVKEYNEKIEHTVNTIIHQLQLLNCNDYEKEKRIHDWICKNITYDDNGSDIDNWVRVMSSHNILGVFAYHTAQCEGIAKAVKVLLNAVDVKCIVVMGRATRDAKKIPHAWNLVNIAGKPYQLDVTWDLGASKRVSNMIAYDYFNLTDSDMGIDHISDNQMPVCKLKEDNYYVKNRIIFRTKYGVFRYVDQMITLGKTEFTFLLEGRLNNRKTLQDIDEHIKEKFGNDGGCSRQIQVRGRIDKGICWVEIR